MPFVKMPGLKGKVYVPEQPPDTPKKHPCPDCFSCQMCTDSRCRVCLGHREDKNTCPCTEKASK